MIPAVLLAMLCALSSLPDVVGGGKQEVDSLQEIDPSLPRPRKERYADHNYDFSMSAGGPAGAVRCTLRSSGLEPDAEALSDYAHSRGEEQYMIHVHGLHHTGTGFLRQTLADALGEAFSDEAEDGRPIAAVQDSLRPYGDLMRVARASARSKKEFLDAKRKIFINYKAPEDEGQHLQNLVPRFVDRVGAFKKANVTMKDAGLLFTAADLCEPDSEDGYEVIGNMMLQQWGPFWDTSAKFLIQKTPSLDVLFMERIKVMPTLHVIIVRHPLVSNALRVPMMQEAWMGAYRHLFEQLNEGRIEWYAVVSYEALIENREVVVEELVEVVKSGIRQGEGDRSRRLRRPHSLDRGRRRLPIHKKDRADESRKYLFPPQSSLKLWTMCAYREECRTSTELLTESVYPYFGFVSITKEGELEALSVAPGPVTVADGFDHVLFSSEVESLRSYREERGYEVGAEYVGDRPPGDLITKMNEIFNRESGNYTLHDTKMQLYYNSALQGRQKSPRAPPLAASGLKSRV